MTYYWDRFETNPIHDQDREEHRSALRYQPGGTCQPGQHQWARSRRHLGVCVNCGDTVSEDET